MKRTTLTRWGFIIGFLISLPLVVLAEDNPTAPSSLAKEVRPVPRPPARKNRRCIRRNTLRIFSGRERRRWLRIVRRSRKVNGGQAPKPHASTHKRFLRLQGHPTSQSKLADVPRPCYNADTRNSTHFGRVETTMATDARTTVYLKRKVYRALKAKAASTDQTVSNLINAAVLEAMREDEVDLSAVVARRKEPSRPFEKVVEDLKRDGLL